MGTTEIVDDTREFLDLKNEIKRLKSEIKKLTVEVSRAQARGDVAVIALAAGAKPDALQDVMGRVDEAGWAVEDGRLVQLNADGTTRSRIGAEEWVKGLRATAKHLFGTQDTGAQYAPGTAPAPQTGGSQGMASGDLEPGQPNPWNDATWNDTQQALLINSDRAKAERIAKAAGSYVGAMPPSMRRKTS
jgi:hypothetical protein